MIKTTLKFLCSAAVKPLGLLLLLTAVSAPAFGADIDISLLNAPEIDGSSLAASATMLIGGVLILRDRYRK